MVRRPRILVAEDDADLLELLADELGSWGAEVVEARTGAELVLRLAESAAVDLIVTDIGMPWMDGLQAVGSMRAAGLRAPVVFITGASDETLRHRIAQLGVEAVLLQKPVDATSLRAAVDDLLRGTRRGR